jgi:hypothetical protein
MWRLLCLLLFALPSWAQPFATSQIPDSRATHCDYEDLTTGEAARVPVVVDLVRGQAVNGHRVCKFDVSHWAPGSAHNARMRAVDTVSGVDPSGWIVATLDRPASAVVSLALVGSAAAPPPPPPPDPMASISEDGTSVANFTAVNGAGLSVVSGAYSNSGSGVYDGSVHNTSMSTGDHYVSGVIGGKAASNYLDLKLRHNGSSGSGANGWQVAVGGSNEWYITETTAGVGTDRASGTTTFANGDVIRGEANGTTIRLLINGVEVGTYTSSLYQANVRVGAAIYRAATVMTVDDFAAADLGGSTTRGMPFGSRSKAFNGGRVFSGPLQ